MVAGETPSPEIEAMTHYWRVRKYLPERFGQRCRPVLFGKLNSVLVEFEDGVRYVTNRHFIRKLHAQNR